MTKARSPILVGLVSDTHGPLPAAAASALSGVGLILHAGDLGSPAVLPALALIAPVRAVRGNSDGSADAIGLPWTRTEEVAGLRIHLLHDLERIDLDPGAAGIAVVVHGHTHRPDRRLLGGVLYVNPGSPSRPRGGFPPSIARLRLGDGPADAELVFLDG